MWWREERYDILAGGYRQFYKGVLFMEASTTIFIISIIALCAAAAAAVFIIRKPFKGSEGTGRSEDSTPKKGPQFKKHYIAPYITYVIKLIMYIGCSALFLVYVIEKQTPDRLWMSGVFIVWAIVIVILAFETRQLNMFRKKREVYAAGK